MGAIELSLASVDDQVALLLDDCKSRKERLERIRKRSVYSTDASTYWYLIMLPWSLLVLLTTLVLLAFCLGFVLIPLVACASLPIMAGGALINYFLWLAGMGDGFSYWPYTTLSVFAAIGVVVYLVNRWLNGR